MLTDTRWQFMARRRRKTRSISTPTPRSVDLRHRPLPVELIREEFRHKPPSLPQKEPIRRQPDLRPVEDLRHAREDKTFRTRSGRPARTESRPQGDVQKSRLSTPLHTYFQDPKRVIVCIRRAVRQRVLFALQRVGKGRKVSREHRFSEQSNIRCK